MTDVAELLLLSFLILGVPTMILCAATWALDRTPDRIVDRLDRALLGGKPDDEDGQ